MNPYFNGKCCTTENNVHDPRVNSKKLKGWRSTKCPKRTDSHFEDEKDCGYSSVKPHKVAQKWTMSGLL